MDEVRGLAAGLQHRAATLQHTLARALHVEPRAERQPELHISVAARPAPPPRLRSAGDRPGLELNPITALYAALAVAGALGAAWAVRAASNARGRRAQGGRWVRDRSLGGKMVRYADICAEACIMCTCSSLNMGSESTRWDDHQGQGTRYNVSFIFIIPFTLTLTLPQVFVEDVPARPPPDRTSDFDLPGQREAAAVLAGPAAPAAAPAAPAPAAAAEGARADSAGEEAMPEWWSSGPRHRASGAYREQVGLQFGQTMIYI